MFCQVINRFFINSVMIYFIINIVVSENGVNISSNELESRIIGGKPVPIELYPASVKFYNFGAFCSGTIINSWCVLTAAHCLDHNKETYDMMIEVGARFTHDSTGEVYSVLNFVIHEAYNITVPFACDVALIYVTRPIKLGKRAKKALLVNNDSWMNINEKNILVAGWGFIKFAGPISQSGLMETRLSFVTTEECERKHRLRITPDMFCLYGDGSRDTCKGDSGGGVLWNGMIVGVVSHGDGCAKKDKPSVYANVWYFRHWIQSQVKNFFKNACNMLHPQEHTKI